MSRFLSVLVSVARADAVDSGLLTLCIVPLRLSSRGVGRFLDPGSGGNLVASKLKLSKGEAMGDTGEVGS